MSLQPDSEQPLGRRFSHLAKSCFGVLSLRLADLDMERYFYPIVLLTSADKNLTQNQLAELVGCDKTIMVRMVDYLTDKGYMQRRTNPGDRREQFVVPTAKAKREAPKIAATIRDVNRLALQGINPDRVKDFFSCLDAIAENLAALPAEKIQIKFRKTKPHESGRPESRGRKNANAKIRMHKEDE